MTCFSAVLQHNDVNLWLRLFIFHFLLGGALCIYDFYGAVWLPAGGSEWVRRWFLVFCSIWIQTVSMIQCNLPEGILVKLFLLNLTFQKWKDDIHFYGPNKTNPRYVPLTRLRAWKNTLSLLLMTQKESESKELMHKNI